VSDRLNSHRIPARSRPLIKDFAKVNGICKGYASLTTTHPYAHLSELGRPSPPAAQLWNFDIVTARVEQAQALEVLIHSEARRFDGLSP
jgi:hypothetical protein